MGPRLQATTPRPRSKSNLSLNPDEMETQPLQSGIPHIDAPGCLAEVMTKLHVEAIPPFPHELQYKNEFREFAQRVAKGTAFSCLFTPAVRVVAVVETLICMCVQERLLQIFSLLLRRRQEASCDCLCLT